MADIKYLKGVQTAATPDGSAIILAGATETDGIFTIAFQTEALGGVVSELLRIGAQPEVRKHATDKRPMQQGALQEARPFEVEAISVGTIPILPAAVLFLDFPSLERISIALSLDESDQLIQQLQESVRKLRSIGAQRPN